MIFLLVSKLQLKFCELQLWAADGVRIHLSLSPKEKKHCKCVYSFTPKNSALIKSLSIKSLETYFHHQLKTFWLFLYSTNWSTIKQSPGFCPFRPVDVHWSSLAHLLLLISFVNKFLSLFCQLWIIPSLSQSVSRGDVGTCKGEERRLGRKGGQIKE